VFSGFAVLFDAPTGAAAAGPPTSIERRSQQAGRATAGIREEFTFNALGELVGKLDHLGTEVLRSELTS
jgi:hypothetical protein